MQEFDIEFDACAFDLKPSLPPEGMSREQVYAGRARLPDGQARLPDGQVYPAGYVDNLLQTARDSGIEMKRPPLIPNTRKAHEATEFAREAGRLLEYHRALFHAYWVDEQNISDLEVLCRLAANCGLDADAFRRALADGRYAARVQEQIDRTRAAGITGVPTTIFDEKFALVGAQDHEVYRDVAKRVASGRLSEG